MKYLSWSLLVGAAAVLSACGGGGGSGMSNSVSGSTPPPVASTPPPVQTADFTTFVKDQFTVQETATPANVETVNFNFADDNNPAAFDDAIVQAGK